MTPNIDDAKARLREVAAVNTQHELGRAIAVVLAELERLQKHEQDTCGECLRKNLTEQP